MQCSRGAAHSRSSAALCGAVQRGTVQCSAEWQCNAEMLWDAQRASVQCGRGAAQSRSSAALCGAVQRGTVQWRVAVQCRDVVRCAMSISAVRQRGSAQPEQCSAVWCSAERDGAVQCRVAVCNAEMLCDALAAWQRSAEQRPYEGCTASAALADRRGQLQGRSCPQPPRGGTAPIAPRRAAACERARRRRSGGGRADLGRPQHPARREGAPASRPREGSRG